MKATQKYCFSPVGTQLPPRDRGHGSQRAIWTQPGQDHHVTGGGGAQGGGGAAHDTTQAPGTTAARSPGAHRLLSLSVLSRGHCWWPCAWQAGMLSGQQLPLRCWSSEHTCDSRPGARSVPPTPRHSWGCALRPGADPTSHVEAAHTLALSALCPQEAAGTWAGAGALVDEVKDMGLVTHLTEQLTNTQGHGVSSGPLRGTGSK